MKSGIHGLRARSGTHRLSSCNRHGYVRPAAVMLVRLRSGKPLETAGRKAMGAKVL